MKDKFSEDLFIDKFRKFIKDRPNKLGVLQEIDRLELKYLGSGESNHNILAVINGQQKLVIRIAQLYKDKLKKEYKILSNIPKDIGPRPIYLDISKDDIPYPFLVESFIQGDSVVNWDKRKLSTLARTLAKLHIKTKKKKNNELSFIKKLEKDNNYFLKNTPELREDEDIMSLVDSVKVYLQSKEKLLDKVDFLSILHGDLNTDNIKIDKEGNIRFIDWELAHYNDPAREFSTFYYDDMQYLNWRIHLQSPLKEFFLNKYIEEAGIEDNDFVERVNFWQTKDKAGAYIYCNWKMITAEDEKTRSKFEKTASLLKNSLKSVIG